MAPKRRPVNPPGVRGRPVGSRRPRYPVKTAVWLTEAQLAWVWALGYPSMSACIRQCVERAMQQEEVE